MSDSSPDPTWAISPFSPWERWVFTYSWFPSFSGASSFWAPSLADPMRAVYAVWLIAIFSLTSRAEVGQPKYLVQDEAPVTFEGYWELVRNTRQAITKMESLPEAEIRQQLDDDAEQWEKVTAVEFPDHSVMQID